MSSKLLIGSNVLSTLSGETKSYTRGYVPQKVTVILPVYNEEISIENIALLTKHYADNVIVTEDGSSDRAAEIARKAGVEVIVHEINTGKGGALKTLVAGEKLQFGPTMHICSYEGC